MGQALEACCGTLRVKDEKEVQIGDKPIAYNPVGKPRKTSGDQTLQTEQGKVASDDPNGGL